MDTITITNTLTDKVLNNPTITYEKVDDNNIKIIEQTTINQTTLVNIEGTQNRINAITSQILELQSEKDKLQLILDSIK